MEQPVFPFGFVAHHCPRVETARRIVRRQYEEEMTDEEAVLHGECAFNSAGAGMMCERCGIHLTRPYLGHAVDREFLPQIEQYYRDMAEYQTWLEANRGRLLEEQSETAFIGAWI